MPFNQPQRTDSWPPTVLRLGAESKGEDSGLATLQHHESNGEVVNEHETLEENPFSYFLSSPDDSDDDEDLSAGIETPDSQSTSPIIRTVSPSDFQSRSTEEPLSPVSSEEDYIYDPYDAELFDIAVAVPLTLCEFSASQSLTESRHRPLRIQSLTKLSGPKPGLVRARSPSSHGLVSSRRLRADTYPLRKPRSWRKPSDDVWTIPEETSSASNSSKDGLESKNKKASTETKSCPSLSLTVPKTPFIPAFAFQEDFQDSLTPPLRLTATLAGEDPTQISVWERTVESTPSGRRLYSALGSPTTPDSQEEQERLSATARMMELEETPFPPEPVLRLPLRRRKTVRFSLPEL